DVYNPAHGRVILHLLRPRLTPCLARILRRLHLLRRRAGREGVWQAAPGGQGLHCARRRRDPLPLQRLMLQTTFGSAAPSDIPHLVRLLGLLFTQEPEFSPNAEKQSEALDAILHDRSRGRIFVARAAGQGAGMASLLYPISPP